MSLKPPSQIIEENPGVAKVWTAQDIGQLLRMGLVDGRKLNGGRSGSIVEEKHVMKLYRLRIAKELGGGTPAR